jgi:hypothetical protein
VTVRTFGASCASLAILLGAPRPASAHRLDEYLQATRLAIGVDRVGLEIDLTPGADVAAGVIAWIDTNRDGGISAAEGATYAGTMLQAVALSVDGQPVPIALVETSYPPLPDMTQGVGTIRLRATAPVSAVGSGRHQLSYSNTHRPEHSVYLVNALVPADPRIQIGRQQRDRLQHDVTVTYDVAGASWPRWLSVCAGMAMIGALAKLRRAERSNRGERSGSWIRLGS